MAFEIFMYAEQASFASIVMRLQQFTPANMHVCNYW